MITQNDYRMPKTGEGWRHYKGGLYIVIGMASDDTGTPMVVYAAPVDFGPPSSLFVQSLDRFLQWVEHDVPRFQLERDEVDIASPFINPTWGQHQ